MILLDEKFCGKKNDRSRGSVPLLLSTKKEVIFMHTYDIAVIPGEDIGKEVVQATLEVLYAVAALHGGLKFNFVSFP